MQPCPSYHLLIVSQYAITNVNLIGQTQPRTTHDRIGRTQHKATHESIQNIQLIHPSQRIILAMNISFHLNHSSNRRNRNGKRRVLLYKKLRGNIAMKIVFITHTSQRRGLTTMWDCNKILQWILHAPFTHGIVRRDWSTKNLTQFMIQKPLPRQIVSGQPKPHATHDPKIPAKAGRFRSTINLTQFITQKSLPKQIISGQRKPHATYNS